MCSGPAPEPRIGADVVQPQRLALAQHHAEHAVLARQRADRRLLAAGQAVHDELGERAGLVRHAERRVPGARRATGPSARSCSTSRTDSWLETASTTWLTCSKISSWPASRADRQTRAAVPGPYDDGTGAAARPDQAAVLGPWSQARPGCRARCAARPRLPSVDDMNDFTTSRRHRGIARPRPGPGRRAGRGRIPAHHRRARQPTRWQPRRPRCAAGTTCRAPPC